jgi:hypothetical protein
METQIGNHGATWLDRELIARERIAIADSGFGREVNNALSRRAQRLVEMGHATAKDGNIHIPARTVATLQRREVERVGQQMAIERGLTYVPANAGEYVSGYHCDYLIRFRYSAIFPSRGPKSIVGRPRHDSKLQPNRYEAR